MSKMSNRNSENQKTGTPDSLWVPVNNFWKFGIDLAASEENFKHENYLSEEDDAFTKNWHELTSLASPGWLNNPYANCGDWMAKCYEEANLGATVVQLQPAALHRNYYKSLCKSGPVAVIVLNRPIKFVGYRDQSSILHALFVWNKGLEELENNLYQFDYQNEREVENVFSLIRKVCV